ncbi:Uncharacterised protein [Serratia liquefaciens]|nr:Uncharacterised protein [Serratia liquefaciens]
MNHTNVVDVKAWIDARPVSRFQWNVLLLCFHHHYAGWV